MGEAFICRRGGALGSGKSMIIVTAPTGSTVTATCGTTVKTAVEKNGQWAFKNCDIGTWTVKAVLGDQTATNEVEITEADQRMWYYVTISYFNATIDVTYPEGAVCTCSNGDITLTAPNATGSHTFMVPSPGDWTITAVDGSESKSVVINVTQQAHYTAIIVFKLVLFDSGYHNSAVTGGFSTTAKVTLGVSSVINVDVWSGVTVPEYISTKNKIDVAGYSVLYVTAKVNWSSSLCSVGLTNNSLSGSFLASVRVGGEKDGPYKTYALDIARFPESYYITASSVDASNEIIISQLWLE